MIKIFSSIIETLLPSYCYGCNSILVSGEKILCVKCLMELERIYDLETNNSNMAKRLSIYSNSIEHTASFLHYEKDSLIQNLIHKFKYQENIIIGKYLTKLYSKELEKALWIRDIDIILPLPLHWRRKLHRGYNQSEIIAREIGKHFNKEVNTRIIKRIKHTKSQVHCTKEERWRNVENAFKIGNKNKLEGKHILLIDDIITTGASLNSCIKILAPIKEIKISVLTLCSTKMV